MINAHNKLYRNYLNLDYQIIDNYTSQTDNKLNNILKEINKTYRTNFYEVIGDYKVSNNTGREKFIKDYLNSYNYKKY